VRSRGPYSPVVRGDRTCRSREPRGDLVTGVADGLGIAHDDQPIGRPGEADVEPFAEAVARPVLVDTEHDRPALHPLRTEDVAVEDVVLLPEGAPVALLAEL